MKSTTTSVVIGLLVVSLVPRTLYAQNREHQQMAADVRMLQEQSQLLAQSLTQLATRLGEITDGLKRLETRLDAAEAASRKTAADQKLSLDSLSSDVRVVRERTQDVNTRIGTLTEEVEALRTSLPSIASQAAAAPADGHDDRSGPGRRGGNLPVAAPQRAVVQQALPDGDGGLHVWKIQPCHQRLSDVAERVAEIRAGRRRALLHRVQLRPGEEVRRRQRRRSTTSSRPIRAATRCPMRTSTSGPRSEPSIR